MLTEAARVTRRQGNLVELELQRGSACSGCELSQGCGTGALGRLLGKRSRPIVIETERECVPGDEVMLAMPESALLRASLLVYGAPLLAMLSFGLLASVAGASELVVAASVGAGLIAGLRIGARAAAKLEQLGMTPHITEVRVNSTGRNRS